MKTCPHCNGILYRHGEAYGDNGQRYRCKSCRKCITVRNGQIVAGRREMVRDWRHGVAA